MGMQYGRVRRKNKKKIPKGEKKKAGRRRKEAMDDFREA